MGSHTLNVYEYDKYPIFKTLPWVNYNGSQQALMIAHFVMPRRAERNEATWIKSASRVISLIFFQFHEISLCLPLAFRLQDTSNRW